MEFVIRCAIMDFQPMREMIPCLMTTKYAEKTNSYFDGDSWFEIETLIYGVNDGPD